MSDMEIFTDVVTGERLIKHYERIPEITPYGPRWRLTSRVEPLGPDPLGDKDNDN